MPGQDFNFSFPRQPDLEPLSAEEAEQILLEKLGKAESDHLTAIWELAFFYSQTSQYPIAQQYMERYIRTTADPEKQAGAYLGLGQTMEKMKEYQAAISFYSQALSLGPTNTPTWYLINNNLGFCLNHFERYVDAEKYCRVAIGIDPERPNAYKNLGISLAGQGQYAEAARNYVLATRVQAADGRALKLLEQLFQDHSEINREFPDILDQVEQCRQAVRMVAEFREKLEKDQ